MNSTSELGDSLPQTLLDNYVQRYRYFLKQRNPHAMGWKEVSYGYTNALVDDISFLIQQCDSGTKTRLINQLQADDPTLWARVQKELTSPIILTT